MKVNTCGKPSQATPTITTHIYYAFQTRCTLASMTNSITPSPSWDRSNELETSLVVNGKDMYYQTNDPL